MRKSFWAILLIAFAIVPAAAVEEGEEEPEVEKKGKEAEEAEARLREVDGRISAVVGKLS